MLQMTRGYATNEDLHKVSHFRFLQIILKKKIFFYVKNHLIDIF